jgi:hypothetical protein
MTARHKRIIEKVESELTLSDLFLLWLTKLQQFNSPAEYMQSALEAGESDCAEYQLLEQASARRKTARDGAPDKSVDVEIVRSLKRLLFLKTLVWAANSECENIVENCRNRLDPALLIAKILKFFRGSDAWARPYRKPPSAECGDAPAGGGEFFVAELNEMVDVLNDLRAVELAVGSISERFFHGRTMIFRSITRAMNEARHDAESCAEELTKIEPDNRTCSQQPESAAQEKSEVVVGKLIDYAKAFALLRFDERAEALEKLKLHLERGCGTPGGTNGQG